MLSFGSLCIGEAVFASFPNNLVLKCICNSSHGLQNQHVETVALFSREQFNGTELRFILNTHLKTPPKKHPKQKDKSHYDEKSYVNEIDKENNNRTEFKDTDDDD